MASNAFVTPLMLPLFIDATITSQLSRLLLGLTSQSPTSLFVLIGCICNYFVDCSGNN